MKEMSKSGTCREERDNNGGKKAAILDLFVI